MVVVWCARGLSYNCTCCCTRVEMSVVRVVEGVVTGSLYNGWFDASLIHSRIVKVNLTSPQEIHLLSIPWSPLLLTVIR